MRIVHAIALAAVAGVSVSAFAEGSIAATARSTVSVGAPSGVLRLNAAQAQRMNGTYRLDDGRMLVVTSTGSKLFADIDGKREQLLRTADHRFVARESGRELEFNTVPFADEVVLRTAAR